MVIEKIIAFVTACLIVFLLLIGCNPEYKDINSEAYGYFTVIESFGNRGSGVFKIVYANDTKVMYFIQDGGQSYGITPLYNADGTLQIYEGN